MRTLLFILSLIACTAAFGQDKQIIVVGDSIAGNSFFLGETHGLRELPDFKFKLVRLLVEKHGVTDIVMEMSNSMAYLFNTYLQENDTAICIGMDIGARQRYQKWQELYTQHKFTIHGIDFERLEFVIAVHHILDKYDGARSTALYKYLDAVQDSALHIDDAKAGYKSRIAIYDDAKGMYEAEKGLLQPLLKTDDLNTVEKIFDNPASEKHIPRRDKTMFTNFCRLQCLDKHFLCMLGAAHTDVSNPYSLLHRYIKKYKPQNHLTLIQVACKNCTAKSYWRETKLPIVIGTKEKGETAENVYNNYDKYYRPDSYILINQMNITELEKHNSVPTYYVLFQDQ